MKIHYECLPCLVNQAIRVAEMTGAPDRDQLLHKIFAYLSELDFSKTNPEIIGAVFALIKEHIGNEDPYQETRNYYNRLFSGITDKFENDINYAESSFECAVKYAIIGNMIDFNPIHNSNIKQIMKTFHNAGQLKLAINHIDKLAADISAANTLLYLGDNCGEICLDKLLIKKIKECYPNLQIFFGVRGKPVVNDSVESDAEFVGLDEYEKIISNGDDSLGTVLDRTSEEFNSIYHNSEVIISKGQANYESLSEQTHKNIYFLLMAKCEVIAKDIGVSPKSLVCKSITNTKER